MDGGSSEREEGEEGGGVQAMSKGFRYVLFTYGDIQRAMQASVVARGLLSDGEKLSYADINPEPDHEDDSVGNVQIEYRIPPVKKVKS